MKLKYLLTGVIASLIFLLPLQAQVGKEMKAFRNKEGITVTMLNPSLYNLYKQSDQSLNTEEILKNIKEINVMQVTRKQTSLKIMEEITQRISPILENESKYNLVRSEQGAFSRERLYVTQNDEQITSLVLWTEDAGILSLIELKGIIHLNRMNKIASVLNVKGLDRLAYINAPTTRTLSDHDHLDRLKKLEQRFGIKRDSLFSKDPFSMFGDNSMTINEMLQKAEEIFQNMGSLFDDMSDREEFTSNGLEIIQENGKTRINVNAKNMEIYYLIDGKEYPADSLKNRIPENLATVNMVQAPNHPKKSYIIINTKEIIGRFISYANGVLKYKYKNQEYSVNPEKLAEPSLVINNRLSRRFSIDPMQIIQIRPATEIERQLLRAPSGQVIIVTDKMDFNF